ncbi:MAG: hypothetical protein HC831_06365 [Chloroflexia bacterium]|nr:hypothetical protein [Chloroflexia bacterium]
MLRNLKQTNTGLLLKILPEANTINSNKINILKDFAVVTIKTKNSSPKREITNALKFAPEFPSGLNKFKQAILYQGNEFNFNRTKLDVFLISETKPSEEFLHYITC